MIDKKMQMRQTNRAYNVPFTVLKKHVRELGAGVEVEDWQVLYPCLWCDFRMVYGKDEDKARQTITQEKIKIILRYGPSISEDMRIKVNGKFYEIDSINNIGLQNNVISIVCNRLALEGE